MTSNPAPTLDADTLKAQWQRATGMTLLDVRTEAEFETAHIPGSYNVPLDTLAEHIEDHDRNTTRFLIMSPEADLTPRGTSGMMTSFVFRVRNIPAALYKAMGGFATNGVNMTKLESYMLDGNFTATQFFADIEGHPDDPAVARAMEELAYFTSTLTVLGTYPADPRRHE